MQNFQDQLLVYFHDFVQSLTSRSDVFDSANLSLTALVFFFVLLAVFLMGLTFGRSRILIGLLSLYAARVLELGFPYFTQAQELLKKQTLVPHFSQSWLHLAVLVVFAMIIFLLLQRSVLRNRLSVADAAILPVAILSFLAMGFFTSLAFIYLPSGLYQSFRPDIQQYFTSPIAQFWWAVAPILALIFLKRKN